MSRTASAMAETICPPHIEGRHPMLYFNIQSTEKYSIAMCYLKGVDPKHSNLIILTFERQSNASIIVNINSKHFSSFSDDQKPH